MQNCFLIPVKPSFPDCLDLQTHKRAARLCNMINKIETDYGAIDLLVLQEVWSEKASLSMRFVNRLLCRSAFARHIVEHYIRDSFRYSTDMRGKPSITSKRLLDSGLIIASRHPIVDQDFFAFGGGSDAVEQLANKGALITAIRLPSDKLVIVCNTHLDAGESSNARFDQLTKIMPFIQSFRENVTLKTGRRIAMTLLCGDFNINGLSPHVYSQLCDSVALAGLKDTWLGSDACITNDGPGDATQRLDYIFSDRPASTTAVTPTSAWRVDSALLDKLSEARSKGKDVGHIEKEIDDRRRRDLTTDHAGLIATFSI